MKAELNKALSEMSETDYRELQLRLQVAELIRLLQISYKQSFIKIANGTQSNINNIKLARLAAYNEIDLRFLAAIQAFKISLDIERAKDYTMVKMEDE